MSRLLRELPVICAGFVLLPLAWPDLALALDLEKVLNSAKPCFKRIYTAEHLEARPRQMVEAIGFETERNATRKGQFQVSLSVRRRGDKARFSGIAYCRFQKPQVVRCGVEGDGGELTVSIGQLDGRKRLKVTTREINLEGKKGVFGFGLNSDDKVFYLGSYRIHHCPV